MLGTEIEHTGSLPENLITKRTEYYLGTHRKDRDTVIHKVPWKHRGKTIQGGLEEYIMYPALY